jgi:hypothetical protein
MFTLCTCSKILQGRSASLVRKAKIDLPLHMKPLKIPTPNLVYLILSERTPIMPMPKLLLIDPMGFVRSVGEVNANYLFSCFVGCHNVPSND